MSADEGERKRVQKVEEMVHNVANSWQVNTLPEQR